MAKNTYEAMLDYVSRRGEKINPEEEGIWDVYGEDPNCDMGGSHVMPHLGRYAGKFGDVLAIAVQHPKW
ncbi:hypothetical protein ACFL0V_07545, partial [Nanoarchaeota archaeon]